MYIKIDPDGTPPESFDFPQVGKLASDSRWIIMDQLIPRSEFEAEYAQNFAVEMGVPAKSFRMASSGINHQREIRMDFVRKQGNLSRARVGSTRALFAIGSDHQKLP